MGKSSPSPPPAPDPAATAAAQAAANRETAITQQNLNLINETTPLGTRTFESFDDPRTGEPRFSSNIDLTPQGQAAFDAEQAVTRGTNELAAGQIGRVESAVQDPFTLEGLAPAPTASLEGRQNVEDALFNRLTRRLDPRFEREEERLRTRLANQGITGGSEAFNDELEQFRENRDETFLSAADQAILAGGAEQSRLFGLGEAERERGIQERSFLRNIPLNEVAALLGTGQVNLPQFGSPSQAGVAPTDVIGAQALSSNIAQQNFQNQLQNNQAFNSGLFGLGSAAIGALPFFGPQIPRSVPGFSDRRLKKHIRKIGKMTNGLFVYMFQYIWGGPLQIGVMADEVRKVLPHAVYNIGGYDAVDYAEVFKCQG